MLIIFAGLPGSGKTTLAQALAKAVGAVYLRIDTIEQNVLDGMGGAVDVGPAGYVVAYAVAEDNLVLGNTVVADSVNALRVTRDAWLFVAARAVAPAVEIEVICSDPHEHRHRVENRMTDVPGRVKPTWQETVDRHYEEWSRRPLVVDTAHRDTDAIVEELIESLGLARKRRPLAKT